MRPGCFPWGCSRLSLARGPAGVLNLAMRSLVLVLVAVLAVACGAKTGLSRPGEERPDAGTIDARVSDVPVFRDVPLDVPPGVDAPLCVSDEGCDDGASCTLDRCVSGFCVHEADDAVCDDGLFCSGTERCDPGGAADPRGCVPGRPVACRDSVSCTVDACDEAMDRCLSTPDVSLCPISHRCDLSLGCLARALAHDRTNLYEIDLPSGMLGLLAPLPVPLTDLALHPDGRLFGAASDALWLVDYEAGTASMVASVPGTFNALDFAPDGNLFGAVNDRVVHIDVDTGVVTNVARFPSRLETSGDVAFIGGRLFATVTRDHFGTDPDILVEVDTLRGTARIINAVGQRCVWGLAPFGETLYGLTCEGLLLEIDTTTGRSTVLRRGSAEFYGAGAR